MPGIKAILVPTGEVLASPANQPGERAAGHAFLRTPDLAGEGQHPLWPLG
jgi:hypothetical protein